MYIGYTVHDAYYTSIKKIISKIKQNKSVTKAKHIVTGIKSYIDLLCYISHDIMRRMKKLDMKYICKYHRPI